MGGPWLDSLTFLIVSLKPTVWASVRVNSDTHDQSPSGLPISQIQGMFSQHRELVNYINRKANAVVHNLATGSFIIYPVYLDVRYSTSIATPCTGRLPNFMDVEYNKKVV